MDDVIATFPLLRLPIDDILNTLRTMDYPQIFGISFLSKKTKNLVESLKLATEGFHVIVRNSVLTVMLNFQNNKTVYFELQAHVRLQELETIGTFRISREYSFNSWRNALSAKQFIDHLKLICHTSITTLRFSGNFEGFSIESIHRNLKDFQSIVLLSENQEYNRRVLRLFQPASLVLPLLYLVDIRVLRNILIQNFDVIRVTLVQITLDNLLMTNARETDMPCRPLSAKVLNKFLKLWSQGSNPRLEWLHLRILGNFQNEELLSGLKYQIASRNTGKLFKSSGNKEPKEVIGGWDIWRLDGTKATITSQIITLFGLHYVDFQLFVWHDHCVLN